MSRVIYKSHVIYINVIHHLKMSFIIYKSHSSFINVAYVLYFGTNGTPYIIGGGLLH